jgi:hypothetical protein
VKYGIQQAAQTYVEEVARRMGLMDARIKALHRQREVHRIQVVKVMAPKCEAADGNRACQYSRAPASASKYLEAKQLACHSQALGGLGWQQSQYITRVT